VKWTILADDRATGSDHKVIEWEVAVDRQQEADHERVVVWNLAAMTRKDTEAAEKLWMEIAKERAQLEPECTEDDVDQEAAWCQEAMSSVLDATAKKIRICARSKRYGMPTLEKDEGLSRKTEGEDGTWRRPSGQRQNSRSRASSRRH
jgi:hypothetical protein